MGGAVNVLLPSLWCVYGPLTETYGLEPRVYYTPTTSPTS